MNEKARRTAAIAAGVALFNPRHRPRKLPRQAMPLHIEKEFARAIAHMLSPRVMREAFADLLRELPELLASAKRERGDRTDADEGKRARELVRRAKEKLANAVSTSAIEKLADEFASKTSTWQRVQLNRQTRAAFGTDIFAGDRNLRNRVANFASENVSLIKGITDELASKVEKTVTRALTSATLHGDLATQLEDQFGYPTRRAEFIARDQIGKLYGQINATRQQELGVERFVWRCVNDDRTRGNPGGIYPDADPSHWHLNGKTFRYDDPPEAGTDGEPCLPGEAILCRCWAEPYFGDILGEDVEA